MSEDSVQSFGSSDRTSPVEQRVALHTEYISVEGQISHERRRRSIHISRIVDISGVH